MNFSIYLDPDISKELEVECKKTGKKRNAIIRGALRKYLKKSSSWPKSVQNFTPDPDATRFESYREELSVPREDIF